MNKTIQHSQTWIMYSRCNFHLWLLYAMAVSSYTGSWWLVPTGGFHMQQAYTAAAKPLNMPRAKFLR